MFHILISDSMLSHVVQHAQKKKGFQIDYRPGIESQELRRIIKSYDALIVRSRTRVTKEIIDAGAALKVIGRAGVGIDNIDAAYARKKGIEVLNTPECSTNSVAEHTMALMLGLVRNLAQADASLKAGRWEKKLFMGAEISGKTLGLIGYGRIGKQVALKAKALGMKVIIYDRRHLEDVIDGFVVYRNMAAFLKEVDVLSVHVPFNDNTKNMIGYRELKMIKRGAVIINCSRGGIVNEVDLIRALKQKMVGAAAVDVFLREPEFNQALVALPNVLATPHIAASTIEAQGRCGIEIIEKTCQRFMFQKKAKDQRSLPMLEMVPTAKIKPHEYFDERRVEPLAKKIMRDQIFTNPPLVTKIGTGSGAWYLILDGSNRVQSLKKLKIRDALVQVVNYKDSRVLLKKWNHIITGFAKKTFLEKLRSISGFVAQPVNVNEAEERVRSHVWLCAAVFDQRHAYGIKWPGTLAGRLQALNELVDIYHNKTQVVRTDAEKMDEWSAQYQPNQILIIFPEFSKDELLAAAKKKLYFPGGITRHLIPQRVLGVNLPLAMLKKISSYPDKARMLEHFLSERKNQGTGLRYYEESIYIFD